MTSRQSDRTNGSVAFLLLGAGTGRRIGGPFPKALIKVAGRPLLAHALDTALAVPGIDEIVITAPTGYVDEFASVAAEATSHGRRPGVRVIEGGVARSDSVAAALGELDHGIEFVLVHDTARAFAPAAAIARVVAALLGGADAVVPVIPVVDTIKSVEADSQSGDGAEYVQATVDRSVLRAVQTPQGFRRETLAEALRDPEARKLATDDAGLVERLGIAVRTVPGDPEAFKITYPFDLIVAEAVDESRRTDEHTTPAHQERAGAV